MSAYNAKNILFLGYTEKRTRLIGELRARGCNVDQRQEPLDLDAELLRYDLMVSFGYQHILTREFLAFYGRNIVNLHISYLPYNRGEYPNFWAFYDNTPHGVTIHLIDAGVDTGPILYQRFVNFTWERTFAQTYQTLIAEIEGLFVDHIEDIISERFTPRPQRGRGTYHRRADLPVIEGGWDADIATTLAALDARIEARQAGAPELFAEIQRLQARNAAHWAEALRLAWTASPHLAESLISKLQADQEQLAALLTRLKS